MSFSFNVTQSAIDKIKTFDGKFLKINITGGGCSGFRYEFDLAEHKEDDDMVIEKEGAKILIDTAFEDMLNNCTLNFEVTLSGSRFKIKNPNAARACGCGNSFAL